MYDGNLYRQTAKGLRLIPAEEKRIVIIEGLHGEIGHWDFATTCEMIKNIFWKLRMQPDIAHFVRSCDPCQKTNSPEQSSPYGKIPVSRLFHTWAIDFAGPLKETEDRIKYLLLAVGHMSCWPVACAIGTDRFNRVGIITFVGKQICWQYGKPA